MPLVSYGISTRSPLPAVDLQFCSSVSRNTKEGSLVPRHTLARVFMSLLPLFLSGCFARGLLYTDTIRPLCTDARMTSLGSIRGSNGSKKVQIPTLRVDLAAEWDSRAIGDIAKKHGITTVYGCDARTKSYILGTWREDSVIIYGD